MPKPHGNRLINRYATRPFAEVQELPTYEVNTNLAEDIINIATGVFSPLTGFLTSNDLDSVVHHKRLADDIPWTIPILFDCNDTNGIKEGDTIYNLSKKYEVSVYKLAKANNLEKPYTLTVGQKFCIPKVPEPSSNYKWSALFKNGNIAVSGEKFKKSHPFIIKVRAMDDMVWYKLGKAVTDKNGELDKTYKVPKALAGESAIYVCLKDGVTDYLDCKRVVKQ